MPTTEPYCFTCHTWADHPGHDTLITVRCAICGHSHGSQYPCQD